jgi:prepilin-type N-terminal cleavage/methylation domain-containing protein
MNKLRFTKSLLQPSTSGFTLIESLVAIIIVSIMLVGIAPVLTLAVANRVQSKRVETASKAAQAYIEALRAGTIDHPHDGSNYVMLKEKPQEYAVPSKNSNLDCAAGKYCNSTPKNLFCFDGDGEAVNNSSDYNKCTANSNKDVLIQGFGLIPNNNGAASNLSNNYRSYKLSVRVYRADAFGTQGNFLKAQPQSTFGSFKANLPLLETTTEIVVEDSGKFKELCKAAGVTGCS